MIAWLDTAGKLNVENGVGQGNGVEVGYPSKGRLQTVNANDPPGTHLILVLVADSDEGGDGANGSAAWDDLNERSFVNWPVPPDVSPGVLLSTCGDDEGPSNWRGPGGEVEGHTQRSYLQEIESRLPDGVVPIAGFFLRTELSP
jgi:hypothetical protein